MKERRKWEAREKVIGKPREQAQEDYIEKVKALVAEYGLKQ
jgi:acyl-CoA-binding protein